MAAKKGDDFNKDTSKSTHISSQKTDDKENVVESMCGIDWGNPWSFYRLLRLKKSKKHRDASGKQKDQSVMKAMIRGRKLKERFLSSDSVFTAKKNERSFCC